MEMFGVFFPRNLRFSHFNLMPGASHCTGKNPKQQNKESKANVNRQLSFCTPKMPLSILLPPCLGDKRHVFLIDLSLASVPQGGLMGLKIAASYWK